MKTYTITNTMTNWTKSGMTAEQVKQFCFNKLQKSGFSPVALVDYQIKDDQTGETLPLSNYSIQ